MATTIGVFIMALIALWISFRWKNKSLDRKLGAKVRSDLYGGPW
jgi:uncharacterized membrane protein YccC